MRSVKSEFKLIKRGFTNPLVLIPGWATDYRIFDSLDLNYDYILPVEFSPLDFEAALSSYLGKNSIHKISLFGWSLGAFLAAEFASKNSEKIEDLFLVGIRRRYNLKSLQEIETKLEKNRKAYLYSFYRDCFSRADKEGWRWFKERLLKDYLENMPLERLLTGLDYLSCVYLKPQALLKVKKIKIFQGTEDKIAPIKYAEVIKSNLPQAEFICVEDSGHALFLNPDFKIIFNE